ncbi:MAG: hypothetical protein IJP74_06780 [Prevotella sp.]|nr:hypothetical protein [Prevotella sp.]
MDTSVQTFINKFLDEHYSEFLDRLATKIQEASTLPLVDYDALRHQAVLMQYVWEGVHQVQAVKPDTYLEQASTLVTAAVNRANTATQAAEDINSQISAAEAQRVLAETARDNAEDARAAAEILRAAAEEARAQAENTRGTNEADRQTQETARQTAESQRSSWFSTFRATVESWYSNENDPNNPGIVQIWNSFKSAADSWKSLAESKFDTFFGTNDDAGIQGLWKRFFLKSQSDFQAATSSADNAALAASTQAGRAAQAAEKANAEAQNLSGLKTDCLNATGAAQSAAQNAGEKMTEIDALVKTINGESSAAPVRMTVSVLETISTKNKEQQHVKVQLYPTYVMQNVLYQKVSGSSVMINPSGVILVTGTGESVFWIIPPQNTELWQQVNVNVRGPRIRLSRSGKMRLNSGRIRIV